jgi:phage FluMu protein gp41
METRLQALEFGHELLNRQIAFAAGPTNGPLVRRKDCMCTLQQNLACLMVLTFPWKVGGVLDNDQILAAEDGAFIS